MATSFHEAIDTLLAGKELSWDAHSSHNAGKIILNTPESRRLFKYLLSQQQDKVTEASEDLFPALIASWENEEYDPKDDINSETTKDINQQFRLSNIETEGFGGLNLFDGKLFTLDVNQESWCLEGQNGSGKTSLISSIIWALTGRQISEHSGLIFDDAKRQPVFDTNGKTIGTWPPIVSYPTSPADLKKDAYIRVKLTFIDQDGNEAFAERSITSKSDGTEPVVKENIDNRLTVSPQLIETGILMPNRLAHINFGEKSQSLYQAVKKLTGLDQLGGIGDGAATLTHGGRKFLKYAKNNGIDKIEVSFTQRITKANEQASEIKTDLSSIQNITSPKIIDDLAALIDIIEKHAIKHAQILKDEVSSEIDITQQQGRQKILEAIGVAKGIAENSSKNVSVFTVLKDLHTEHKANNLEQISNCIADAEKKLNTAISWHIQQQKDEKLRLKALASQWYEEPESPQDLPKCPLCIGDLETIEQNELKEELKTLKAAGDEAEKHLADVCRKIHEELKESVPASLRNKINSLSILDPKAEITSAAKVLFTEQAPFNDILCGISTIMNNNISTREDKLPDYISDIPPSEINSDDEPVKLVVEYINELLKTLSLSEWWSTHRADFGTFWKDIIGIVPDGDQIGIETLLGQINKIEEALTASMPYDAVLSELNEIIKLSAEWKLINDEQIKRKEIALELEPLKELRTFVNTETASSISSLTDNIKLILQRIHIKERFDFHDAGLKRKEVHVHGSFSENMKIDALPIANTSWLRAILWAFIYALRETTLEKLQANPFPLILLDDPQTTFDPRNKRKWAHELTRLGNLPQDDFQNAQIFITTHERQFFTLITETESFDGQNGLIAPVDVSSGTISIVNGNIMERLYQKASENMDDAAAREFISKTRIYIEKLLKHMLRSEGNHINSLNLGSLIREIDKLRNNHTAPFTRKPFEDIIKVLSNKSRSIKLINTSPHDDDETVGLAEAKDVLEYWQNHIKDALHNAFQCLVAFESYSGDPRTFDYSATVVELPIGQKDKLKSAELLNTGIAAAAKTDGRCGDGLLQLNHSDEAEKITLYNHEIYQLTANTLEPVASIGDLIIVSNYVGIKPRDLIVTAFGDNLLARRINTSAEHPDLAILTAQAIDPSSIAEPKITPLGNISPKKIVGTLFIADTFPVMSDNEIKEIESPDEYFKLLNKANLFKVKGRSAEPIALDGQYLMVGQAIDDVQEWKKLDGQLVVCIDSDDNSYFKRFRPKPSGIYILESLNPDGTTSAEILSHDEQSNLPQISQVLPVLGVLFELPETS